MTGPRDCQGEARQQLRWLLLWASISVLGAALSAPWVYRVAPRLGALLGRDGIEFRRLFDRLFMASLAAGLLLMLRRWGRPSAREIGWVFPRGWAREVGTAATIAALSVGIVQGLNLALGWRVVAPVTGLADIPRLAAVGLVSGASVALLEEVFFRGWLQRLMSVAWGTAPAVTVGAAAYALPHYLRGPLVPEGMTGLEWDAGLRAVPSCLRYFEPHRELWLSMAVLWVVGVALASLRARTGRLTWALGLHAGWVAALRIAGAATEQGARTWRWLGGGPGMTDGVAGLVVLLACWWVTTRAAESRLASRPGAGAK